MKKNKPIRKLLAANRSEIAIRIFRAANELGLRTVAIYSEQDRLALHRFKADEAYQVGAGKGPVEAYLDIAGIVALAKEKDVDAIHPGYGFLAENPAFARACEKAGITFIGPTPELLELLGDKTAARRLAASADVRVLPGTEKSVKSILEAEKIAFEIGYPVIVKAAMGGGGRGMRVVHDAEQLAQKLEEAQGEARSAFGDASVFLEKYLPHARHIEVQILGDEHGNLLHLYERDCSVQRRHQKVVEVAPASTGHTTLFENQIGVSSANGGTFPAGSTTGGGALVAQFDNTCRTFSARPVFESVVVEIPAPGGAWTDGASVTISPSSMAVFPYSAINWAAFAPANAQFVDVVGAFWAGTTTGKKRFDALNTTVAVLGVTNAGGLFEVQTTYVHGLATGGSVNITGVVGLPANGQWFVTVIDSTHFTLQGSTYSGSYVSGGTVQYSAITSITGLGVQPVNTVTLNTGHVATGLGLTNEPLYVELLVAYPSGNGLSNTPTADFSTTQTTFLVNNPTLLPNTTPIYFDQTLLTTAPNPSYSYYNPTLLTPAPNPLAALDWPHREALLTYTTQAGPSVVLSADSETPGNQHFTLPERATSITTVTKAPVAFGGGVTFSLDVSGRVVTISGGTTAPGDTLTVTYKAIRPFPQNGEQVSVFFNTRAPQTSRNQIIGTSLTVIPKYIPKQLYALTSGCASPDYGFPFPFAYVQTGGIFATVFNPAGLGELELNGESQISIADFNSTTGMLTLPTFVGYTPDPDAVVFTRTSGNIDSEGRTFFSTVPNAYIPSAFAQDLSDPQRHKNFLPFLAELPTNSALGFAGELVMVVLIRWAAADAYNGVYFSSPLVSHMSGVITTSAAVFRLRNNMLNRHV